MLTTVEHKNRFAHTKLAATAERQPIFLWKDSSSQHILFIEYFLRFSAVSTFIRIHLGSS
jgi:hypothetical protein